MAFLPPGDRRVRGSLPDPGLRRLSVNLSALSQAPAGPTVNSRRWKPADEVAPDHINPVSREGLTAPVVRSRQGRDHLLVFVIRRFHLRMTSGAIISTP
jgi:hypothetical protein